MKDIIQLAFEDTVSYVKGLNTTKYFDNIFSKAVTHNSIWYNLRESFIKGYVQRYNLSPLPLHNFKDIYASIDSTIKEYKEVLKMLEEQEKPWSNASSFLYSSISKTLSSINLETVENLDDLSQEVINFTKKELNNAQITIKNMKTEINDKIAILDKKKRQNDFVQELKLYESNFIKLSFKNYTEQLTIMLKSFFQTEHLYIKFNFESFYKELREDRYSTLKVFRDSSLSYFEQYLLGFINKFKRDIEIVIYKNNKTIRLNLKQKTFSVANYSDTLVKNSKQLGLLELQLDNFLNNNPGFKVIYSLKSKVASSSYKKVENVDNFLNSILFHYYEDKVIEEFNEIVTNIRIEKEKEPTWDDIVGITGNKALEEIKSLFPDIVIETRQVQNLGYKIALNKEVYDTQVVSFTNQTSVLKFLEPKGED